MEPPNNNPTIIISLNACQYVILGKLKIPGIVQFHSHFKMTGAIKSHATINIINEAQKLSSIENNCLMTKTAYIIKTLLQD